ncbi:Rieske (2Fe-2S) protein [Catellatospora citrea]|uniref:Rieske (2Fe-2S) protein n=1 Tax=Catellatospora citrea TaxID=53366 RepID=UPI000E762F2F|nr:Rieske (2Fe-2S) protein [Catellatospora citrea]RKE02657.1 Rieske-like 2Fe-2S protein [Catellatospora citrea]
MGTTRRVVLSGTAASAISLVGACGSSGEPGGSAPQPPAAPPTGPVVLGPSSDVALHSGKVYTTEQVVVTQPVEGSFKAFTSICTHKQCQVGSVENDQIICPCHGSRYSAADGSVLQGPATLPLAPKTITVADGKITLD